MRQNQYKTDLENRFIPQIRDRFSDGKSFHFMQGESHCKVKVILQSQNIPLLHWPSNSPDMNPIENMWEVVKRKSERREHN